MRNLDKRDSSILQNKMSLQIKKATSIRNLDKTISSGSIYQVTSKSKRSRHKSFAEKKPFNEQIWHMGKVIGTVKGVF